MLAVGVTLALVLMACAPEEEVDAPDPGAPEDAEEAPETEVPEAPEEPDEDPDARAGGTLTVGLYFEPEALDPMEAQGAHEANVLRNVYDPVLIADPFDYTYDSNPQILEEWGPSEDGMTWTLTLREGITFHDGTTATAEDLKYSLEENIANATRAAELLALVDEIVATDDLTVELRMESPDRMIELALTFMYLQKADPDLDLQAQPMGTGPFSFAEWDRGNRIVLERHEDYWMPDRPYLDRVEIRFIPDASARAAALRAGEIDLDMQVPLPSVGTLQGAGIQTAVPPNELPTGYYGIFLNTRETADGQPNPFHDYRVRQALSYAIDREAITEALFGFMTPTANPMYPVFEEYWVDDVPEYEYNPERARELLADAGYPDGLEDIPFWVVVPRADFEPMAALIQNSAQDAGIGIDIRAVDVATWREVVISEPERNHIALNAANPSADPYDLVIHVFDKVHGDWAGWPEHPDGAEFYADLQAARSIADDAEWVEAVQDLLRHGMEHQPHIVIGGRQLPVGFPPEVNGFVPRVRTEMFLRDVWIDR